ncbi:MAG: hypothetical protein ACK2UL_06685, partial [Anaerolineae bacterium]
PAVQDDLEDPSSASFKHAQSFEQDSPRLSVTLSADPSDILLVLVMYDANDDGEFSFPLELLDYATSQDAEAVVSIDSPAAGDYQIWVHGYQVSEEPTTFDLRIEAVTVGPLYATGAPEEAVAGETIDMEICVDTSRLAGEYGPALGLLSIGPAGAPNLIQIPVLWQRFPEIIHLPIAHRNAAQ